MKKVLLALGIFLAVALSAIVWNLPALNPKSKEPEKLTELKIGKTSFLVEIADDIASRMKGLSGRQMLAENQGMLFIFPIAGQYSFWMKGMEFPLDIIWISGDKVIGLAENLPPDDSSVPAIYSPPAPVDKVLEINAGLVKQAGIKVGDMIELTK